MARWELLAGDSAQALAPVTQAARSGFETALRADSKPFVAARGYDAAGAVLTTTAAVRPKAD